MQRLVNLYLYLYLFSSLNGNPLVCDCDLERVMQGLMQSNRQSVFAASGATCSKSAINFYPGANAEQVLTRLYCSGQWIRPIRLCVQSLWLAVILSNKISCITTIIAFALLQFKPYIDWSGYLNNSESARAFVVSVPYIVGSWRNFNAPTCE